MWSTRLWLTEGDDDYLVEPKELGPEMKRGQRFIYTPGDFPISPDPDPDPPLPEFVEGLVEDLVEDLSEKDQRLLQEQERERWAQKTKPLKGEWFVDELYWELAEGLWIQNVVLIRTKPRST